MSFFRLQNVEHDLIRTRTARGRSRAQAQGQQMGRPPALTPAQPKEATRHIVDFPRCEGFAPLKMKRKGMETAVFWLVIVGPILIGVAGAAWYGGRQTLALWMGFVGTVFLLLAGALQSQLAILAKHSSCA